MSREPVIAVVYSVPLVVEALVDGLRGLGEVRAFPASTGDVEGLLGSLQPAAVVVDRDDEALTASRYAHAAGIPVVHVDLRARSVRLFAGARWRDTHEDTSPQAVRNLLAAAIYGANVA